MDLFKELVTKEKQHRNFRVISSSEIYKYERAILQGWSDGFIDRDNKFVKEFQTTFDSSFWELYVFACFKELGFICDFSYESPDFVLSTQSGALIAEAVIASHPEGYAPEWEKDLNKDEISELDIATMLELASLRLANAITSKHRKYVDHYSKMKHAKNKSFVVCLAPFEQPYFFIQMDNALRRVLYKFDQPLYVDDPETGERHYLGESHIQEAQKITGSPVSFGYFTDARMSEVSAIFFSYTATFTKVRALSTTNDYPTLFFARRYNAQGKEPHQITASKPEYEESLLDGVHVCLNPFARYPMDPTLFLDHEIAIHHYFPESESYMVDAPDGFLIEHGCISFPPSKKLRELKKLIKPKGKYKVHKVTSWPEGQLKKIGGYTGPFSDNHMAHFNGWTIVVAHDSIDRDWGAQAIEGTYKTLAQYVKANSKRKGEMLLLNKWYNTKEKAFEAMKAKIKRRQDEHQG